MEIFPKYRLFILVECQVGTTRGLDLYASKCIQVSLRQESHVRKTRSPPIDLLEDNWKRSRDSPERLLPCQETPQSSYWRLMPGTHQCTYTVQDGATHCAINSAFCSCRPQMTPECAIVKMMHHLCYPDLPLGVPLAGEI